MKPKYLPAVVAVAMAIAKTANNPTHIKPYKTQTVPYGGLPDEPERLPNGCQRFYFDANGIERPKGSDSIAYSCIARNLKNAKRKFVNEYENQL